MVIEILVGISGSGKSTYAHSKWKENPLNTLIVNRDKIRELLYGYTEENVSEYYSRPDLGKLEKQVTIYEDTLIHDGLNHGKSVIIDATNLRREYIERFKFWNVPTEVKFFQTDLRTALIRDSYRTRSVGQEVIKKQFNLFNSIKSCTFDFSITTFNNPYSLKQCYIVDIDGTVAEKGSRNPFDWKRVGEDTAIRDVHSMVYDLAQNDEGVEIIFCSGRDEICREETQNWLNHHFKSVGQVFKLYMRKNKDMRPDWIVKEELWAQIVKEGYHIVSLIDDRNQVCRRARAIGLTVAQVDYGNF